MKEIDLYKQLAHYMAMKHPGVPYHFDLSGIHNPSPVSRGIYSRLNGRGYPDLFVAAPCVRVEPVYPDSDFEATRHYNGLFLELKVEGKRLRKKTGEWVDEHVAEQAEWLDKLSEQGYIAMFAVGLDEACDLIDSYLEAV